MIRRLFILVIRLFEQLARNYPAWRTSDASNAARFYKCSNAVTHTAARWRMNQWPLLPPNELLCFMLFRDYKSGERRLIINWNEIQIKAYRSIPLLFIFTIFIAVSIIIFIIIIIIVIVVVVVILIIIMIIYYYFSYYQSLRYYTYK